MCTQLSAAMHLVALFSALPFCLAHVMEKAVTPLDLTRDQGAPPKKQTRYKSRRAQLHSEAVGNLWVSVLVDCSCLGATHAAVVFNVDIVDLLDPWVVAGREETLVFNLDIVDFLDPWVAAGGEETLVFNFDVVDLLDPRKAAGREEKAA